MVQRSSGAGLCSALLLLGLLHLPAGAAGRFAPPPPLHEQVSGEPDVEDLEWGSGSSLLHLLHSFPADSPFASETPEKPLNCSQRFWLPPSSDICWDDIAGPKEFAESRLLVLQNRAALQALSDSSGVEEGGASYKRQAREEVQGVYSDHQTAVETIETMEKVFVSLAETRREGKELGILTGLKENLVDTQDAIQGRESAADVLERHFSLLETTFVNMQWRLSKLARQ